MASAFNTLSVPHVTLELLRALRDRGCTLVNLELLVRIDREWSPARVLRTDQDFRKARPLSDTQAGATRLHPTGGHGHSRVSMCSSCTCMA
jgi:hypothetical protein